MLDDTPKLLDIIVIIHEKEGLEGVDKYAEAIHIPVDVCRRLLNDYLAAQVEPHKDSGLGWPAV